MPYAWPEMASVSGPPGKNEPMKTEGTRHHVLLGATYGAAWSLVAAGVLAGIGAGLREIMAYMPYFLPCGVATGIIVTLFFRRPLRAARPAATLLLWGPLALLVGTLCFALCMALCGAATEYLRNGRVNLHDLGIMFFWYPFMAFASVVPVFLAAANCWDLRRRLAA